MNRLGRISVFTLSILGLSLLAGLATSHQVRAAVAALVQVSNTSANPVPIEPVDASNAFQWTGDVGFDNVQVPIPAGKRLVVEYIAMSGAVIGNGGPTQPVIFVQSSLTGGSSATFELEPAAAPFGISGEGQVQFQSPVKIYADTLYLSGAFAGYDFSFYNVQVSISGHLVSMS